MFLIALVIGTGVMLSVRNVNVSFLDSSGECAEEYEATRRNFDKLKGSGLLFIGGEDIYGKISAPEKLAVVSYEKKFPCTVDIVIRERVECFAVKREDGYDVYDEQGKIMDVRADNGGVPLARDGCPDVLVYAADSQIERVAEFMGNFKEEFGSLRRLAASVSAERYLELSLITVTLRSGLKISVSGWESRAADKIKKARETYLSLSEAQRTCGTVTVVDGRDGAAPVAKYSAQ